MFITNEENEPLSYVFVYDKNASKGYLSDEKGECNIFCERGTEILFSHVGYKNFSYKIPAIGNTKILFLRVKLKYDTIMLKEITIFPWRNYQDFINAFLTVQLSEDEIDYANRNFEITKRQILEIDNFDDFQSPSIAYKISHQIMNDQLYWKGQTQPLQILNISAWAEFIRYIREGKFKNKRSPNP